MSWISPSAWVTCRPPALKNHLKLNPPISVAYASLVVDDSWHVGSGLKSLLKSLGADVIGPAATTADAERMVSERRPDVAIVDINLRGGERSYGLIDRLYDQGIRVVVMTGYADAGLPQGKAAVILQKPIRQDVLLANLRPPAPIGVKE